MSELEIESSPNLTVVEDLSTQLVSAIIVESASNETVDEDLSTENEHINQVSGIP